jgi:putative sigma-54 modulation protein
MKDYAYEKADKLARYFGAKEAVVTLKIERDRNIAEFIVYAPKHHTFVAESDHPDMYAAIDIVSEKMERQLRKLKEKWSDHHAREVREPEEAQAAAPPPEMPEEMEDFEEEEE